MSAISEKFHFVYSHELEDRIQIKMFVLITYFFSKTFYFTYNFSCSVDGERPEQSINELFQLQTSSFVRNLNDTKHNEPYVICQVFSDGQPLCLPVQTSFKSFTDKWKYV